MPVAIARRSGTAIALIMRCLHDLGAGRLCAGDAHAYDIVRLSAAGILHGQQNPTIFCAAERNDMSTELTDTIVAWATEVATHAAALPSRQSREDYLAERRRELLTGAQAEGAGADEAAVLADTCVNAAREIMIELLALRAGVPQGRA